jgi:hypothetical protein
MIHLPYMSTGNLLGGAQEEERLNSCIWISISAPSVAIIFTDFGSRSPGILYLCVVQ